METAAVLPEELPPVLPGVVIARPAPVRPELGQPAAAQPRRLEPRAPALPARPPTTDAGDVRMPEPEPSIVVVAARVRRPDERGRLLAIEPRPRTSPNPKVEVAPDLPADTITVPQPAPPERRGSGRGERYSQD